MASIFHRRARSIAGIAVGALLLAACGSEPASDAGSASTSTAGAPATTTAPDASVPTSADGLEKPTVDSLPTVPLAELGVTDITDGTGAAAAEGDTVVVHYLGVRSEDGTEFDNSFDRGEPFPVGPLGQASVIDGWNQGLIGVKAGGRRQLDIPNALAYGDSPQGSVIQAGDDLTFIVDVLAVIPATTADQQPDVTVAPSSGATELGITELVEGTGAEAAAGSNVAIQYIAFSGADGTMLDSGWEYGAPLTFTVGTDGVLAGFDQGVVGMRVGGRRQVVIPPDLAFGPDGNESLGLPAGADLIVVFDLLAMY